MPFKLFTTPILTVSLAVSTLFACNKSTKSVTKTSLDKTQSKLSATRTREFDNVFFEAQKEKQIGNTLRAINKFTDATKIDPDNSVCYYEIGRLQITNNQMAEAEIATLKATELDKENRYYFLQLSDIYRQRGKWDMSIKTLEYLNKIDPQNSNHLMEVARIQEYIKRPDQALKTYNKIEKIYGPSEEVSFNRYRIYYGSMNLKSATIEAQKLHNQDPTNPRYTLLLADAYTKSGKYDEAYDLLKDLNVPEANLSIAEILYQKGDMKGSYNALKKAFADPSIDINTKVNILFNNYLRPEKLTEQTKQDAYELTEILVKTHDNDAKSHAIYADFLYQDKKFDQALKEYKRSRDLKNDIFAVWTQIFSILQEQGKSKELELECEKALELFPNQPIVYVYTSRARIDQKNYSNGLIIAGRGLKTVVDNQELESEFYNLMGECYYNLGQYDEMVKHYDLALERSPDNIAILNNYAYYSALVNVNLEKALSMAKKVIDAAPKNPNYQDTYAYVLYKNGQYKLAETYLLQSLSISPDNADVIDHYGNVLFKLGRIDEAVQNWKKAKDKGLKSEFIDKKIKEKKLYE